MMRWHDRKAFSLPTLARAAGMLGQDQAQMPSMPILTFSPEGQVVAMGHRTYLSLIATLRLDDAIANLFHNGFWLGYYYAQTEMMTSLLDQLPPDGASQGDASGSDSG